MAYELVKEKIVLDRNVGDEKTQILLEGDIIVPDIKPDMAIMLQADSKITIEKTEVLGDRVNFVGKLYIQVLYLARGDEKPVHSINIVAPVDDFINVEGVTADMWVEVKSDIQNIDFRMINDRKINYKAIVEICAKAESTKAYEVVVDIEGMPCNQQLKRELTLNKSVANKADRFIVKDDISISQGKPNIREILQTNVEVGNQDVRVQNGKVNVFGELIITTLYKGEDDDSIIEFMEHELSFNGNIDLPECREDMFADVVFNLGERYIQVKADDDGEDRIIEIEAEVCVNCKVSATVSIEVLEDAYAINKTMNISKDPISYPKLITRNKNQSNVKEVIQLDENCPEILQIFRVKGKAIVDEIKVIADKVIVEGVIETDILYIAQNDDTPLYSHKAILPFRQIIEAKGAEPDMKIGLNASVDHISFNMLSGKEVEVRILISFNTSVSKMFEASMITHVDFDDIDSDFIENMPSIILYVVQNDDTLWKIAKRFNTSIDEIVSVNDIENPDKFYPGQKLLILKKVYMD